MTLKASTRLKPNPFSTARAGGLFLAAVLLSTAGCYGGDYGQVYRCSFPEGYTELEWRHCWEPRQFFVYKTCQGRVETLTVLVGSDSIGKTLTLGSPEAAARYEHGGMARCERPHRVEGTVTLLEKSPAGVRAKLDVAMFCPREEKLVLKGEYTFEVKFSP
jgi:hypothetical protein